MRVRVAQKQNIIGRSSVEEFMANKLGIVAVMVASAPFSVPLFAHHGAASFDSGKMITVKGIVTEYVWTNPHVLVKVDAKDDTGNITHWVLEAWNPVTQASRGWSKNTFKAGDEVSLDITPAKNNAPVGEIRGRIVINGKEFKQSQ
jgi:hypothetical protein